MCYRYYVECVYVYIIFLEKREKIGERKREGERGREKEGKRSKRVYEYGQRFRLKCGEKWPRRSMHRCISISRRDQPRM